MLSRREQIIKALVANDVNELVEAVRSHTYDELVAILRDGFPGYNNMSDRQLEDIWHAEGFGEFR